MIVCEDQKSAPNYFNALKKHLNLSATSIRVVGGRGRSAPIQIVDRAVKLKNEAESKDSGTLPFDYVFCVIDGDYGAKIKDARGNADRNQIQLAISTKCFEYWILLHFEENNKPTLNCAETVGFLKNGHIRDYEKGSCDFRDVVTRVGDACERAEKFRALSVRDGVMPEDQNPCSEIYILVNRIIETGRV